MFDFAWTEIAVVVVVALIAIGPKDMPVALRAVTDAIKKARRMASEFQTHVDEMVKDADLAEVRDQINELRNFDVKGAVERAIDPDGSITSTLNSDPLTPEGWSAGDEPAASTPEPEPEPLDPELLAIPAFVPPAVARPPSPPAFVPPSTMLHPAPHA